MKKPLHLQAHTVFLWLALLQSCAFLFLVDPFNHFTHGPERFLHLSYLAYVTLGGEENTLPLEYIAYADGKNPVWVGKKFPGAIEGWRAQAALDSTLTVGYESDMNPRVYSPVAYLPQLGMFIIGEALQLPPKYLVLLSQLAACAVTIALGYYTLKILPVLKWQVCVLFLVPTMAMNRLLPMPDAMTVHLCVFFIAFFLHVRQKGELLTRREFWIFLMTALLIGQHKTVYAALPAILLFLPVTHFTSAKQRWSVVSLIIGGACLSSSLWATYVLQHFPQIDHVSISMVKLKREILLIGQEPFVYLQHMFGIFTSAGYYDKWIKNLILWDKGFTIASYPLFIYLLFFLWIGSPLLASESHLPYRASWIERAAYAAVFVLWWAMMITASMLAASNGNTAQGTTAIQGRYLLPLLPILWLSFLPCVRVNDKALNYVHLALLFFVIAANAVFIPRII